MSSMKPLKTKNKDDDFTVHHRFYPLMVLCVHILTVTQVSVNTGREQRKGKVKAYLFFPQI